MNSILRKSHNVDLEDRISSYNQKVDYNKSNIEKILFQSTSKKIEVYLSHSSEQKQGHYFATNEFIEKAKLYVSKQSNDSHYCLIVNLNKKFLVNAAYLAYLHCSDGYQDRELDIIPFISYKHVRNEFLYICNMLITVDVNIPGPKMYNDLNIMEKHIAHVIEYVKLKIKYFEYSISNFEQYRLAVTAVDAKATADLVKAHEKILEQSSNGN